MFAAYQVASEVQLARLAKLLLTLSAGRTIRWVNESVGLDCLRQLEALESLLARGWRLPAPQEALRSELFRAA
jgi:hypothetical protein